MEAIAEKHPQHVMHVKHQIDYANAVAEAYNEQWKQWIATELPKMIDEEIDRYLAQSKAQIKLDEKSVRDVRTKVHELLRSLFQG